MTAPRPHKDVKIFGERNTSTNALRKLIEQNAASRVLPSIAKEVAPESGPAKQAARGQKGQRRRIEALNDAAFADAPPRHAWKHAATHFDDLSSFEDVFVVLCVRHPASWLLALYKRPYHRLQARQETFQAFLMAPWQTVGRDRLDGRRLTPITLLNEKLHSYLALRAGLKAAGVACQTVAFEHFAADQLGVFTALRPWLLDPAEAPAEIAASTKDPTRDAAYYRRYYGEALWRSEIPDPAMAHLNAGVDWTLANAFGYTPLD